MLISLLTFSLLVLICVGLFIYKKKFPVTEWKRVRLFDYVVLSVLSSKYHCRWSWELKKVRNDEKWVVTLTAGESSITVGDRLTIAGAAWECVRRFTISSH